MDRSLLIATLAATLTGLVNAFIYVIGIANSISDFSALIVFSIIGAGIVLLAVVVWGFPTHFLLKRYHKQTIGWYILVGSIPSLLIPLIYLLVGHNPTLISVTLFLHMQVCRLVLHFG